MFRIYRNEYFRLDEECKCTTKITLYPIHTTGGILSGSKALVKTLQPFNYCMTSVCKHVTQWWTVELFECLMKVLKYLKFTPLSQHQSPLFTILCRYYHLPLIRLSLSMSVHFSDNSQMNFIYGNSRHGPRFIWGCNFFLFWLHVFFWRKRKVSWG